MEFYNEITYYQFKSFVEKLGFKIYNKVYYVDKEESFDMFLLFSIKRKSEVIYSNDIFVTNVPDKLIMKGSLSMDNHHYRMLKIKPHLNYIIKQLILAS